MGSEHVIESVYALRSMHTDEIYFRVVRYELDERGHPSKRYVGRLVWEEYKSGQPIGNSFPVTTQVWDRFINESRSMGLLGESRVDSGCLSATQAHLADMRDLALDLVSDLRRSLEISRG